MVQIEDALIEGAIGSGKLHKRLQYGLQHREQELAFG